MFISAVTELEAFNEDLKLQGNPIWLDSFEKRQEKELGTVLVNVQEPRQADRDFLYINGLRLRVYKYRENNRAKLKKQCSNCQKYGHLANGCTRMTKCLYCAQNHSSSKHECSVVTCTSKGKPCEHIEPKCSNCQESHFANSGNCSLRPKSLINFQNKSSNQPVDIEMGLETPKRDISKRKTAEMTGKSPTPVRSKVNRLETNLQRMQRVEIPVFKC